MADSVLITSLFKCSALRICDIRIALEQNRRNPHIKEFVFLCEGNPTVLAETFGVDLWTERKVELVEIKDRVRFHDFFEHANRLYRGKVVIACNSDIYFDDTLGMVLNLDYLADPSGNNSRLMVLTRHNLCMVNGIKIEGVGRINGGSNDAWIFKSPILRFSWDIKVGIIGCDAYVAQSAKRGGLIVTNPCLSVRAIHFHPSLERGEQNLKGNQNYWHADDYVCAEITPCSL